jgi:hypothetical protein
MHSRHAVLEGPMSAHIWTVTILLAVALAPCACSPGSETTAPPALAVAPEGLDFDDQAGARFLEVSNAGGGSLTFKVKVGAESNGITWLTVEPNTGTLSGGSSKGLLVSVANREELLPGSYLGELTVEAEGLESHKVTVTMIVGQPILAIEPTSAIDFGLEGESRSLTVTNSGKGVLHYSLALPGFWLFSSTPLAAPLSSGASESFTLTVDRDLVPWYGVGQGDLVVSSNGITDGVHAAVAIVDVVVETDGSCSSDAECVKEGYYCSAGNCTVKQLPGKECDSAAACKSGNCVDGFCCNDACTGQCWTCVAPASVGVCSPKATKSECNDGDKCTVGDSCDNGVCNGGSQLDCSLFDVEPCSSGVCDPQSGLCNAVVEPGNCAIDDVCVPDGAPHPEYPCQSCVASESTDGWTLAEQYCLIAGQCLTTGEEAGQPCHVCNPKTPFEPSEVGDGIGCNDGNPCTLDECQAGVCVGANVPDGTGCDDGSDCSEASACIAGKCEALGQLCDDQNPCTQDLCEAGQECVHKAAQDGLDCPPDLAACTLDVCMAGVCDHPVKLGQCLVDNQCVNEGDMAPGSHCLACFAEQDQHQWSPVELGTACDDDNVCTLDGSCDGLGDCVGAPSKTPELCSSELDNTDPCLIGACDPLQGGCQLVPANEGLQCDLPGAFAQCLEGNCTLIECEEGHGNCDEETSGCEALVHYDPENCGECGTLCELEQALDTCYLGKCLVVKCKEGYLDCDNLDETGCETPLAADPENCGECGLACTAVAASKVGICIEGQCDEMACPEGAIDADGEPGNGCEVQAIVFVDSAHLDDPVQNGSPDHPYSTIQQGIDAALPGFTVFVREGNYQGPVVIAKAALQLIGESADGVLLDVGEQIAGVLITKSDVVVRKFTIANARYGVHFDSSLLAPIVGGEISDLLITVMTGPHGEDADAAGIFLDHASGVDIKNVHVDGITGGNAEDLQAANVPLAADSGGAATGILIVNAVGGKIVQCTIKDIVGGSGGSAPNGNEAHYTQSGWGGNVAGIRVVASSELVLTDNSVSGLQAGTGGNVDIGSLDNCGWVPAALGGGTAVAFKLESASSLVLDGNQAEGVIGGKGGWGNNSCGGGGGLSAGFHLTNSAGNSFTENTTTQIVGGPPGDNLGVFDARTQEGFGFYFESDSLDNNVAISNTHGGQPVVYRYGIQGEVISGFALTAAVNPTNLGKLVVLNSSAVKVEDNLVANFRGAVGTKGNSKNAAVNKVATPGDDGIGIRVELCLNCQVTGNEVSSIHGGQGGACVGNIWGYSTSTCAEGGAAHGILVAQSESIVVSDNLVTLVTGGEGGYMAGGSGNLRGNGGLGGTANGLAVQGGTGLELSANQVGEITGGNGGLAMGKSIVGAGGRAAGLRFSDASGGTVHGNRARALSGGRGGFFYLTASLNNYFGWGAGYDEHYKPAGGAAGLVIEDASNLPMANNSVGFLAAGQPFTGGSPESMCIHLSGAKSSPINHLTCFNVGLAASELGHGIVSDEPVYTVQVMDSIVASVSGYGLKLTDSKVASYLKADYTDFFDCTSGEAQNATIQTHCLASDPLFENAGAGLDGLLPASPCIDAGNPASPYSVEAAPNGCAVNLGAYGNTAESTSAPGEQQHCE